MPGVNANAVAEFTLGVMLSALRRIGQLNTQTRQGAWVVQPEVADNLRELRGLKKLAELRDTDIITPEGFETPRRRNYWLGFRGDDLGTSAYSSSSVTSLAEQSEFALTERRRRRTDRAWGYHTAQV